MKLELIDINKSFSHKAVLNQVTLTFEAGQLHALLGQNGAGKSTTANIINGEIQPDSGQIKIDNKTVTFHSPKDAIKHKIGYVHQRPYLADSITVKENLLLGQKNCNSKQITQILEQWTDNIKGNTLMRNLDSGNRFFIALCSALLKNPELLILDEPTALLDNSQREFLYKKLKIMGSQGMIIIIITHNFDEAEKYCDTINFLKDGKVTEITKEELLNMEPSSVKISDNKGLDSEQGFFVNNLSCLNKNTPSLYNVSFSAKKGEITLIKGLPEDGLLTLENILSGMKLKNCTGNITIKYNNNNFEFNLRKNSFTTKALRNLQNINTAIIPTNSRFRGSNPDLTVKQILGDNAKELIKKANIQITEEEPGANLSGGMLQKLIFAREFQNKPDLVLLFNPMQGLDVKTCEEIYSCMKERSENNAIVIILSTGTFDSSLAHTKYLLKAGELKCITSE